MVKTITTKSTKITETEIITTYEKGSPDVEETNEKDEPKEAEDDASDEAEDEPEDKANTANTANTDKVEDKEAAEQVALEKEDKDETDSIMTSHDVTLFILNNIKLSTDKQFKGMAQIILNYIKLENEVEKAKELANAAGTSSSIEKPAEQAAESPSVEKPAESEKSAEQVALEKEEATRFLASYVKLADLERVKEIWSKHKVDDLTIRNTLHCLDKSNAGNLEVYKWLMHNTPIPLVYNLGISRLPLSAIPDSKIIDYIDNQWHPLNKKSQEQKIMDIRRIVMQTIGNKDAGRLAEIMKCLKKHNKITLLYTNNKVKRNGEIEVVFVNDYVIFARDDHVYDVKVIDVLMSYIPEFSQSLLSTKQLEEYRTYLNDLYAKKAELCQPSE
jgi:hypothetical protein